MKKSAKVIALACATALLTTTIFTDQALAEKETDQEQFLFPLMPDL